MMLVIGVFTNSLEFHNQSTHCACVPRINGNSLFCDILIIDLHYSLLIYTVVLILVTLNNYWMRLSMISRIIQTEVNVICRSEAEADNIDRGLNNS